MTAPSVESRRRPCAGEHLSLAGLAAAVLLSVLPDSASRFYAWPWYGWWQVLLLVPPLLLGLRLLRGLSPARGLGFANDVALQGGLLVFVLSSLASPLTGAGLTHLSQPLALVSATYLFADWLERGREQSGSAFGDRAAQWLAAPALVLVAAALLPWLVQVLAQVLAVDGAAAPWRLRNQQPFGHAIYVAGAMLVCAHVLVLAGLASRGRRRLGWLLGAALALAVLLFTTQSRAGILALGCGLPAAGLAWWWVRRPPLRRLLPWLLAALVLLVAAVLSESRLRNLVTRGAWSQEARASNLQREAMIEAGLRMGNESPLLGQGPGTVPLHYPVHASALPEAAPSVLELHSTPAQVYAELGLAGLSLLACLVAGGALSVLRGLREARRGASPWPSLVFASLLVSYGCFLLTEFQADLPLPTLLCLGLLVLASAPPRPQGGAAAPAVPAASPALPRLLGAVLLLFLALSVHTQWSECRSRCLLSRALDASLAGQHEDFDRLAGEAADLAPFPVYALNQLAACTAEQGLRGGGTVLQARAADYLLRSLSAYPNQEYARFNLGWLLLTRDPAAAERHLLACLRLMPKKQRLFLGLALARHNQGRHAAAVEALALEFLAHPGSLALPLLGSGPLAPLRDEAAALAARHRSELLADAGALDAAVRQRLAEDAVLQAWWLGDETAPSGPAALSAPGQRLGALRSALGARPAPGSPTPPSLQQFEALLGGPAFEPGSPEAQALAALAARHPGSLRELLTADLTDFPGLLGLARNSRPGYNVIMRNHDGLPLEDLDLLAESRLVLRCQTRLFGERGAVPAALLLRLFHPGAPSP